MIRTYISWSEMNKEEREFYEKTLINYIDRLIEHGATDEQIKDMVDNYLLFTQDGMGIPRVMIDTTNY